MKQLDLFMGDCLELLREIPDGSVDLVLCDLPYGTTACAWDSVIPFDQLWAEYRRVTKPNAAIVLTASRSLRSWSRRTWRTTGTAWCGRKNKA